jgi:hypothetical protein
MQIPTPETPEDKTRIYGLLKLLGVRDVAFGFATMTLAMYDLANRGRSGNAESSMIASLP